MKRTPTGIITAITPKGKNILKDIEIKFTQLQHRVETYFEIRGRDIDDYESIHVLPLSEKERLNDFFESVHIGNATASVKFTVDKVIWSECIPGLFALVCIPPSWSEDYTVSNNVVVVTPHYGCVELYSSDFDKLGFDLKDICGE